MRALWLMGSAVVLAACQCVQLPGSLRCTPEECAPALCGADGLCVAPDAGNDAGLDDAGCVPTTSCVAAGWECGLLETGCGERECGVCPTGATCGRLARGRCAACDPAFDLPDPDFVDSDCDGLDGTADGGLFIDPNLGSDGPLSPGTRELPLRSLARAQTLISRQNIHTLFIAEGSLEGVTWREPVSLAGGYRSQTWARSSTAVTRLATAGTGLRLEGVPATVALSGLTIEALAVPAGPAVGLELMSSPVLLQSVTIRAAAGAPGDDGAAGAAGLPGGNGAQGTRGQSGPLTCGFFGCYTVQPNDFVEGGTGPCGAGLQGRAPPYPDPLMPRPLDGVLFRPTGMECTSCPCLTADGGEELARGADGDAGAGGRDGDAGVTRVSVASPGQLDAGRWVRAPALPPGEDGLDGLAGEGGEGGGSAQYRESIGILEVAFGSVGGGGGAPGCGGRGGQNGAPGFPSIGVIVVGAAPRFLGVRVETSAGGTGGAAGAGGLGGSGGDGGAGGPSWEALCGVRPGFSLEEQGVGGTKASSFFAGRGGAGGPAGRGGRGADGAPGAGGASIGVWCERAMLDEFPTVQLAAGGDGGIGPGGVVGPRGAMIDFLNCR